MAANFNKQLKSKKEEKILTEAEKVVAANKLNVKLGRKPVYNNARQMLTIRMDVDLIERLEVLAKEKHGGNKTIAVNEIIEKYLDENGY